MQRLKKFYSEVVAVNLKKKFNYPNLNQVPKIQCIIINRGFGEAFQNAKLLDASLEELSYIAGQKGVIKYAKKAVAGFKVREGMPIGMTVTLRDNRMYGFLDRLINLALPRIRDFQGLSPNSFDGSGNFCLGLTEQLMFPEIDFDKINNVQGMDIAIITSCKNDEEGLALLKEFKMPFKN